MYRAKGTKPWWVNNYSEVALLYIKTGQFKKARNIFKLAQKDFPDENILLMYQSVLYFIEKEYDKGEEISIPDLLIYRTIHIRV